MMMQQTAAAAVVLLMAMAMPMAQTNLLVSAQTQTIRNFIQKPQLSKLVPKSKENDWVSFDKNTEFLPADATSTASSNMARMLASSSTTYNPYAAQAFVDGVNTEYDSYQQAWRYLGFMIDCDASTDDDNNSGSGDQGTDDGCERYVLWAAYVDLGYEGGGISEYQYWDRWTNEWDATSCNYNQNSGDNSGDDNDDGPRCAKMDCHLEDTHFSLLGFFKHKDIDDWFGQLFKHEGMCIWTESEYSFMKNAKGAWPAGCSISTTYIDDDESQPIYYDIKPTSGGGMTLGLYTDTRCIVEYVNQGSDDPITVENVLGNIIVEGGSGSGDNDGDDASAQYETLEEALAAWDSAFDIFKICQPCVAHDLENVGYNTDDDASKGSNYGNYNTDDDNNNGGYSDFDCYDDADYTNVNQCMKFMAKTTMNAATFRDLSLAGEQGTLVSAPLAGLYNSDSSSTSKSQTKNKHSGLTNFMAVSFFIVSAVGMMVSLLYFRKVKRETSLTKINVRSPTATVIRRPFYDKITLV